MELQPEAGRGHTGHQDGRVHLLVQVLDTAGEIGGVADYTVLAAPVGTEPTCHDVAGMNADADADGA
jgi:hypothetical protein